jgi:hypothetical protein
MKLRLCILWILKEQSHLANADKALWGLGELLLYCKIQGMN